MADENKRVIQYPEKNTVDNTDYVLIDSSPNGTNRYQVARILTEAEAAAQTKVDAEAAAREAADDELKADLTAEQTARQNADSNLQTSINNEKTAREAYGFSVVNGVLNVTYTATA